MDQANPPDETPPPENYTAANIVVLGYPEAVRKRPAMYVGSTDSRGVHHLVTDLLDETVAQVAGGSGRSIALTLHRDGSATVRDDGPGFPIEAGTDQPTLEAAMTRMYTGFSSRNGLGLAVLNALLETVAVEVCRKGMRWRQSFARGRVVSLLERLGPTRETGNSIRFRPDPDIFAEASFEVSMIADRLADLAALNPELRFDFRDERSGLNQTWERRGGLVDLVLDRNRGRQTLHEPIAFRGRAGKTEVRFAFQYHDGSKADLHMFVNQQRVSSKSSNHLRGFLKALRRVLNPDREPWSQEILDFDRSPISVVLPGLSAAVAIDLEEPIFAGALREELENRSAKEITFAVAYLRLWTLFAENPEVARKIGARVRLSAAALGS